MSFLNSYLALGSGWHLMELIDMSKKYARYWRKEGLALTDGLICPRCGANGPGKPVGLKCNCNDGICFDSDWRRSPCDSTVCAICGWKGRLKSKLFETTYRNSRCIKSENGWHVVRVDVIKNDNPAPLTMQVLCIECGVIGHFTIDCINAVTWEPLASNK